MFWKYRKKVFGTEQVTKNTKSLEDVLKIMTKISPDDPEAKNKLQWLISENPQLSNNYVVSNIISEIPYLSSYKPTPEDIEKYKNKVNKVKDAIRLCIVDLLEQNDDIQNIDIEKDLILSEKTKNTITMLDRTLKAKDILQEYWVSLPTWVIFYWPPGVWKTECARWLSKSSEFHFIYISMADIVHGIVWSSEKSMTDIFQNARNQTIKSWKPTIIFIDEADKLLWNRKEQQHSLVQHFLSLVDWFYKNKWILTILSTNAKEMLDKAVLSRMVEKVEFLLPNEIEIKEIMRVHILKWVTNEKLKEVFSDFFVENQKALIDVCATLYQNKASWRDVKHIIHTAKRDFALKHIDSNNEKFDITYLKQWIIKNMPDYKDE